MVKCKFFLFLVIHLILVENDILKYQLRHCYKYKILKLWFRNNIYVYVCVCVYEKRFRTYGNNYHERNDQRLL